MKKAFALLLVLALCLSLCACGKSEAVKEVESLIEAIGEVTVDSGEDIQKAEDAYLALNEDERKKVSNYDDLEQAQEDFEDIGIHLTMDNYQDYLNVEFDPYLFDAQDYARMMGLDRDIGSYVYYGIETNVNVTGKSDRYDYNNVVVTVQYTGYYVPFTADVIKQINKNEMTHEDYFTSSMVDIDVTLTAETDIAGEAAETHSIVPADGAWVMESSVAISYEVVDVSGILTK